MIYNPGTPLRVGLKYSVDGKIVIHWTSTTNFFYLPVVILFGISTATISVYRLGVTWCCTSTHEWELRTNADIVMCNLRIWLASNFK